ncbi:Zn-binding domain-containing protein (plasmid) [Halorutilales archaeon Cl-col2-1]
MSEKQIDILKSRNGKVLTLDTGDEDAYVWFADVRVKESFQKYLIRDRRTQEVLEEYPLDLPDIEVETEAFYITLPDSLRRDLMAGIESGSEDDDKYLGGLHAAEHGLIAMTPREVLCDRNDLGGLSISRHDGTNEATIFVHEGIEGGVGICKEAFESIEDLIQKSLDMITTCGCESGCPSCVYSPKCGNNNETIDKEMSVEILEKLAGSL